MAREPFHVPAPCHNCPFRREGGIRLRAGRVREIAGGMLDSQGHTFDCHKTVQLDDDGSTPVGGKRLHCAGALVFAEKQGNATQMMRIAERLGMYDAKGLLDAYSVVIFDDMDEMLSTAVDRSTKGRRRKKERTGR